MPACKNSSPRKPIPTKTNLEATNYLSCLETYQWDRETQLRSLCVLVSLQGFMLMKIPLVSPSLVFCFTIFGCLMNWFRNISMEHDWKSWRQLIWIYVVYLYITYIYISYIYAHMYAVYIQSVLTYIFHLWGLSNVKASLRRAEIIVIFDLFLFSVVFFPFFLFNPIWQKKMLKTNWCCVFLFVFSHFAVLWPVATLLQQLVSRHLCTQEEFYQGYSRLVNFTEETVGWRCAVVRCGLTWSHGCDELSFNKRTRN